MIYERLGLSLENPQVISVVGAGGKTSLITLLAEELKVLNKKVLSTTSTQIFKPNNIDYFFLNKIPEDFIPRSGSITSFGDYVKDGKLIGPNIKDINMLIRRQIFDCILIEADGANRKALKAHAGHEPVVSELSTITIGLIGLDCLGEVLDESNFHRSELISNIIDKQVGQEIDSNDIVHLILNKNGAFKGSIGRKILILNKANTATKIKAGKFIREKLQNQDMDILICNIVTKEFF